MKAAAFWLAVLGCAPAFATSGWTQFGANPQRTFWLQQHSQLNKRSVRKLHLDWKVKLDNRAKELNALTVPLIVSLKTPSGERTYVLIAGSSDDVFALDAASGAEVWKKHFEVTAKPTQEPDWLCPNALTATPAVDAAKQLLYVLDSGGQLHSLNVLTGEEAQPPRTFTPPFAKTWSLNLWGGVLYTATSQACNRVRSAIYAIGAETGEAQQFLAMHTYGAGIWGRAGVAVDENGTVFAGTGDGIFNPAEGQYPNCILAVDGRTLRLKDYFTPKNYAYIAKKDLDMGNTTPVVFHYGRKELVAAGGKEGLLWLLDAECLGGEDHSTPLYATPLITNEKGSYYAHGFWGALSTWVDKHGKRWLYAPAWGPATSNTKFRNTYGDAPAGSVMAFQVAGPDSHPVLEPVWQSVNMAVPAPVIIANGVVLALADGDNIDQNDANGRLLKSEFRASNPAGHAILYALDAETGKVLFSSESTISGFAHFSGIAAAGRQVFAVTWDNTVYAFSSK